MPVTLDRRHSDSLKWGRYRGRDVLPLWVADSDYAVAPEIVAALRERLQHPIFGYGETTQAFRAAVVAHLAQNYAWEIEPEWVCATPGVVPALNLCRGLALARQRTHALTVSPVYPHLRQATPLLDFFEHSYSEILDDGAGWRVDFADLERQLRPESGLLLLCNPHNPLGKVYRRDELEAFAELALKNDLLVCSDEIHCDLGLVGAPHIPIATLDAAVAKRTITLMAPSKTFNIPGLSCAFAVISDAELRQKFQKLQHGLASDVNVLGMVAATAAYQSGGAWYAEMRAQLQKLAAVVYQRINAMPLLAMKPVHATYLAWIDATRLPVAHPQAFFERAGVALSDGRDFGWPGWLRLNFACDEALLEQALLRMEQALGSLEI